MTKRNAYFIGGGSGLGAALAALAGSEGRVNRRADRRDRRDRAGATATGSHIPLKGSTVAYVCTGAQVTRI
jgi:hypothetical protein